MPNFLIKLSETAIVKISIFAPSIIFKTKKCTFIFTTKHTMRGPLFYSKILLFGEYGIIKDSKGLSIPYNFYNGALKIDKHHTISTQKSNASLKRFVGYLENIQMENPSLVSFDMEKLKTDVENGLYFDSSIPQGYGVGSSGALVAAVYDKYATNKITVLENLTREKMLTLKTIFAEMESFFHGKSSGLDPLNSY